MKQLKCRYCKRYDGVQTFHTRAVWQEISGEDNPTEYPTCRVVVHETQGVKTEKMYRFDVVQEDRAEQPCEPVLSVWGRLVKFVRSDAAMYWEREEATE